MKNVDSIFKTEIYKNKKIINKHYKLESIKQKKQSIILEMMLGYYNLLLDNNISVPKLLDYNVNLKFSFTNCGENIYQLMKSNPQGFYNKNEGYFDKMIDICGKAVDGSIFLDPHIKNFTVKSDKIYFVDIFPPYSIEYLNILIDSNPSNADRIKKQIMLFSPKLIANHFLADFKKTFNKETLIFELLVNKMIGKSLIKKYDDYIINDIINTENKNQRDDNFYIC